jgi:hypothetical protein
MNYFSADYFESRAKFRSAVAEAGGHLEHHQHPSAKGPGGEDLTVDVAVFGTSPAPKVFFNLNGVHGNESYSGGAAQLQWISSGALGRLPDDVAVVLVHDLNPFGWAWDSQLNEDLVNLNRNFIDFENPPESDELHHAIADAITFEEFTFAEMGRAWDRVMALVTTFGEERFNAGLMVGQYIAPRGVNYGGTKPAWSNTLLRELAGTHLLKAEEVAILDWHTGLGGYGEPYPLHRWEVGSGAWRRTAAWWGEDATRRGGAGVMTEGAEQDDAPTSAIHGLAITSLHDAAPEAAIAGGVIEFGTVPFDLVAQAACLDIWLMYDAPGKDLDTRFWRYLERSLFAPRDPGWESSVLRHAEGFYERMLEGLIDW